jgi:hypothetical protein
MSACTWGALPGRITPMDAQTCTVDLSGDWLLQLAAILVGLDADYTVDAESDVMDYLATVADGAQHAANPSGNDHDAPPGAG